LHRNSKNVARDKDLYTGDCTFRGILPQKYPMSLLNLVFLGILPFLFTPSGALVLHTPGPGELLISEIMADPSPGAGSWPECEYLELFNPTERTLLLRDIQLRAGSRTVLLPEAQLRPGGYLLLCPRGQSPGFGGVGTVLELVSFPVLANSGAELSLSNAQGQVLEHLKYSDTWYRDGKKKNGGWSLERVRYDRPASCASNWVASGALSGGTPGSPNAIGHTDVDTLGPKLLQVLPLSPYELRVTFDEVLGDVFPVMFSLRPFLPLAALQKMEDGTEALIVLGGPMQEGAAYRVSVSAAVTDCAGNPAGRIQEVNTGLPALPGAGEVVVNEILFEAATGGEDFIELFNRSEKMISLEGLVLRNAHKSGGVRETHISFPWILMPGEHLAFSPYPAGLRQRYAPPDTARIVYAALPTLEAPQGNITLAMQGRVLDSVDYTATWHHPLMKDSRGISLERISPSAPNSAAGWHSSAKGATPGYRNSQFFPVIGHSVGATFFFQLESPVFSPNGDGYQDVVKLVYRPPAPGYLATIRIFDANGHAIAEIANNTPLAAEGEFRWDGSRSGSAGIRAGLYVIWIACTHPEGGHFTQKMTCTLSGGY
jgi:hypothetical protein